MALDNVPERYAGTVVAKARAAAKRDRPPTERQIRQLRFIWMRGTLTATDLPALNWLDAGGLICRRLLYVPKEPGGKLEVTPRGKRYALGS
jgi:hypothetical protein